MKAIQHILTASVLLAAMARGRGQPIITNQPLAITNLAGSTATFSVGAEGTPPLAYEWWYGGKGFPVSLGGETNAFLWLTNVQALSNAGPYWVVVTNSEGAITSSIATLTVLTPPTILLQPANATASLFAGAAFRVTAGGDAPLSYQWRFNDADLAGMTNAVLAVTNVEHTNAGNYAVVVTNLAGSITSQVAALTIVPFNSIYCFGYSWTDTQDLIHGCGGPTACPSCYWQGRYSNGPMWPELLSTNLGLIYAAADNYAHCGAGASDVLGQTVNFSAPAKPELSLYFLMFSDDILRGFPPDGLGTGYLNVTNEVAWNQVIETGILDNSNAVSRLYARGARAVVVQSEIDGSKFPTAISSFGNDTAGLANIGEYCTLYNLGFSNAVNAFSQTKPDLRIVWVDLYTKLNDVIADPAQYGFTQTTVDALDDPGLTDKSLTGPGADYVFWNGLHPTAKVHALMAAWTLEALTNSVLEALNVTMASGSPSVQMNHLQIGRSYTLERSRDLSTWSSALAFTATAGTNLWVGTPNGANPEFYRLNWQQ